jgi:hypothetical protein
MDKTLIGGFQKFLNTPINGKALSALIKLGFIFTFISSNTEMRDEKVHDI